MNVTTTTIQIQTHVSKDKLIKTPIRTITTKPDNEFNNNNDKNPKVSINNKDESNYFVNQHHHHHHYHY